MCSETNEKIASSLREFSDLLSRSTDFRLTSLVESTIQPFLNIVWKLRIEGSARNNPGM
jgi:hypothetical protein